MLKLYKNQTAPRSCPFTQIFHKLTNNLINLHQNDQPTKWFFPFKESLNIKRKKNQPPRQQPQNWNMWPASQSRLSNISLNPNVGGAWWEREREWNQLVNKREIGGVMKMTWEIDWGDELYVRQLRLKNTHILTNIASDRAVS